MTRDVITILSVASLVSHCTCMLNVEQRSISNTTHYAIELMRNFSFVGRHAAP